MYASLDRADIELEPDEDGRQRFVQTDHRSAKEIEQEPELSVLFGLIRVLNPKRLVEEGSLEPVVTYNAMEPPPDFLDHAIHAAGGELTIGDAMQPVSAEGEPPQLEELAEPAFTNLARNVAAEFGTSMTLEGLATAEKALVEVAGDPEEDEIAYWSAVVKLGSLGGEVIRASNGGHWMTVESGTLPFALMTRFRGEEVKVNPLGKAIKCLADPEGESVANLANVICSQP